MSNRGSNNGGGGLQSLPSVPASLKKVVQSLKEIVNCPEPEIYAMLRECHMDPNEAVSRLLSQDPFHEVKSKREKKKENKDSSETWSRGVSKTLNRGWSGADHNVGRGGLTPFSSSESGASHGKAAYRKENGTNHHTSSLSGASGMAGNNSIRQPRAISDFVTTEAKISSMDMVDGILPSSEPSPGYQPAWGGVPGQVSMADIVKMGRPSNKGSITTNSNPSHLSINNQHLQRPPSTVSNHDLNPSNHDEWPLFEQKLAPNFPSEVEAPAELELHSDQSNLPFDRINQHPEPQTDGDWAEEDGGVENLRATHVRSTSFRSRNVSDDNGGVASVSDSDLYRDTSSSQAQSRAFEHQQAEDNGFSLSSATEDLQQLSLQHEKVTPPKEDGPSVVIPDHLQAQIADCSHLSFGSFGTGINALLSGTVTPNPLKTYMEEAPSEVNTLSIVHSDNRNTEYYGNDSIGTASADNIVRRGDVNAENYDSPSASQPEMLKQESLVAVHGNQYAFPSSSPDYNYENAKQLNADSQTGSHMQNLASFSNMMAYTNSLSSALLASNAHHPLRESDLPYSPFPITQSTPTKYGNTLSSVSNSTISMSEALKNAGVATGPALPQQLTVHPYSQPSLPYANMMGYPLLPHQSYAYLSSAFQQQPFAGNGAAYDQSLAALLPQYKNTASLPQSTAAAAAAIPSSGYGNGGAFGSSGSYDQAISSQYKDINHLISLQQIENSGMWLQGAGSRTASAVPASTYYSFQNQNQNQQPSVLRQVHQNEGYQNFYHSQTGLSLDPRDGLIGGSHAQPNEQPQRIWQNGY